MPGKPSLTANRIFVTTIVLLLSSCNTDLLKGRTFQCDNIGSACGKGCLCVAAQPGAGYRGWCQCLEDKSCQSSQDCDVGRTCWQETCQVRECMGTSDCLPLDICAPGTTIGMDASKNYCTARQCGLGAADCPDGGDCREGICVFIDGRDVIQPDSNAEDQGFDDYRPDLAADIGQDLALEIGRDTDNPPPDDVPAEAGCTRNCTGRECGSDGCDGFCGTGCIEGTSTCDILNGTCVPVCDWTTARPTSWSPVGTISSLQTPSVTGDVQAKCFDYTGDGLGDNGLKGLATQVNGPLNDAVAGGDIAIMLELTGVTDFANSFFQLNGLLGKSTAAPPATTGDFYVQEASYNQQTCQPMILFKNATIAAGVLAAGPSIFQLSIPFEAELVIDVTLVQARLKGNVINGSTTDGFELTDGVLSGVLTKEQLVAAVTKLQATCDAAPDPKPSFCSYIGVVNSAMAMVFDMHQERDEAGVATGVFVAKSKELPGDAASICLTYGMSKAKVVGFEPTIP